MFHISTKQDWLAVTRVLLVQLSITDATHYISIISPWLILTGGGIIGTFCITGEDKCVYEDVLAFSPSPFSFF